MPAMTALFSRIIPILFVSDLAAERDFYIRLGFQVTYEGPEYPDFASLGHGSIEFGIERREGFTRGGLEVPRAPRPHPERLSPAA